jgi:hypothetical protein
MDLPGISTLRVEIAVIILCVQGNLIAIKNLQKYHPGRQSFEINISEKMYKLFDLNVDLLKTNYKIQK